VSKSHYITREELRELVGREQRAPIIAWLREKRWRFTLDADGWPKVARAYHDRQLGLAEGEAPKTEAEPDFSAINLRRVA